MVTIMGDHDTNTLTFNPETCRFNECALLRIQQMTYLAKTANRLLHAVRARRLHHSPDTIILHATMRDAANLDTTGTLQTFTDLDGMELFHQAHPMAASAYRTLMIDLPWFRGKPLASGLRSVADFCLCCSLPFHEHGGSCRLPVGLPHCGFFCKLCWNSAISNHGCKAIIRQITAIQRWARNPHISQSRLYVESDDDTDSDTGVQYYFRPELIGHYVSNYPTYVSLLPAAAEQDQDSRSQSLDHLSMLAQITEQNQALRSEKSQVEERMKEDAIASVVTSSTIHRLSEELESKRVVECTLCLLCQQAITLEQCSSHPDQVKSFCKQCWSVSNKQCRQLLAEQPAPAAANCTHPAPSSSGKVRSKHSACNWTC